MILSIIKINYYGLKPIALWEKGSRIQGAK